MAISFEMCVNKTFKIDKLSIIYRGYKFVAPKFISFINYFTLSLNKFIKLF